MRSASPWIAFAPVTVVIVLLVEPVKAVWEIDCQEQLLSPSSLKNLVPPDSPVDLITVPSTGISL